MNCQCAKKILVNISNYLVKHSVPCGTMFNKIKLHHVDNSVAFQQKKTYGKEEFRLRHYAGEVSYSIKGFMDKNNDLLYRDLKQALADSSSEIVTKLYPKVGGPTHSKGNVHMTYLWRKIMKTETSSLWTARNALVME